MYPIDRLNIDTIGPLPADSEGFTHIIVVIDVFSRFIELYKCKDTSAPAAVDAIVQHVGRYGTPAQILTDNGGQYIADMTEQLCRLIATDHKPFYHTLTKRTQSSREQTMK